MNSKVTGKSSNVLAYFSSLLAIISIAGLVLFIAQLMLSTGSIGSRLFSMEMIYLQLFILGILGPSLLFCSYLSLQLKLTSRFYRLAVKSAALAMLPIFPCVWLLGLYALWLSRRPSTEPNQ